MTDISWDRLVVITSSHGEKFIGWVPESAGDPASYIADRGALREPITLEDVRTLVGQAAPSVDSRGNIRGISKMLLLMPIDMLNEPMPSYSIVPSSWYFPKDNGDSCKKKVEELLAHAVESEARMSAAEAGIHLATPVAMRPQ